MSLFRRTTVCDKCGHIFASHPRGFELPDYCNPCRYPLVEEACNKRAFIEWCNINYERLNKMRIKEATEQAKKYADGFNKLTGINPYHLNIVDSQNGYGVIGES